MGLWKRNPVTSFTPESLNLSKPLESPFGAWASTPGILILFKGSGIFEMHRLPPHPRVFQCAANVENHCSKSI